jgi:glycosyl transferase family 25
MANLSTYVLNLDRHPDRLARMAEQLDAQGIAWARFAAVDASKVSEEVFDTLVAPTGPIPRMTRGARACTAGHIAILKVFLAEGSDYALVLEDDAVLAETLGNDLVALLATGAFDLLNLNRQTPRRGSKRLVVRRRSALTMDQFSVHDLVGIHYGTAGYLISRAAAQVVLDLYPRPNLPIDHILFNPNVSRLFGRIRIQQLFPALVRPREGLVSSIQTEPVAEAGRYRNKLQRARTEIAVAPRLLLGVAAGFYTVKHLNFGGARGAGRPK